MLQIIYMWVLISPKKILTRKKNNSERSKLALINIPRNIHVIRYLLGFLWCKLKKNKGKVAMYPNSNKVSNNEKWSSNLSRQDFQ